MPHRIGVKLRDGLFTRTISMGNTAMPAAAFQLSTLENVLVTAPRIPSASQFLRSQIARLSVVANVGSRFLGPIGGAIAAADIIGAGIILVSELEDLSRDVLLAEAIVALSLGSQTATTAPILLPEVSLDIPVNDEGVPIVTAQTSPVGAYIGEEVFVTAERLSQDAFSLTFQGDASFVPRITLLSVAAGTAYPHPIADNPAISLVLPIHLNEYNSTNYPVVDQEVGAYPHPVAGQLPNVYPHPMETIDLLSAGTPPLVAPGISAVVPMQDSAAPIIQPTTISLAPAAHVPGLTVTVSTTPAVNAWSNVAAMAHTLLNDHKNIGQLFYMAVQRFITVTWGTITELGDGYRAFSQNAHLGLPGRTYLFTYPNGSVVRVRGDAPLSSLTWRQQAGALIAMERGDIEMNLDMEGYMMDFTAMTAGDMAIGLQMGAEAAIVRDIPVLNNLMGLPSTWVNRYHNAMGT